ncbi:MAG TPA: hypothetical protein VGY66_13260 [Gemmataceae bacterium]|jgi:hypothetical protein|nr:hypothetical protein [Gemmataceae bacterium]
MKRFVFATLAALAAVVASEQQAKAWFNLGVGTSTNFNISWGGHQRCGSQSEPWPHTTGMPNFPWYGPYQGAGYGMPMPYAMPAYGSPGSGYVAPMPGSGSGSSGYYYMPAPTAYAYGAPYYTAGVQHAYYEVPAYYYGR